MDTAADVRPRGILHVKCADRQRLQSSPHHPPCTLPPASLWYKSVVCYLSTLLYPPACQSLVEEEEGGPALGLLLRVREGRPAPTGYGRAAVILPHPSDRGEHRSLPFPSPSSSTLAWSCGSEKVGL